MNKGSRDKRIAQSGMLVAANQEGAVNNNVFSPLAYENPGLKKQADNNDGDEGDSGTGSIALSVEQLAAYFQALLNKLRRQHDGQGKFGICPLSEDPNGLLGKENSGSCGFGESPQPHPLLSSTQQYSGIDDSMTPIPAENPEASKKFPEKRLENQKRLQNNLGLGAKTTLAR